MPRLSDSVFSPPGIVVLCVINGVSSSEIPCDSLPNKKQHGLLIFELNMDHPLVNRLMIESNEAVFEKRATLMHMQALLLSGEELSAPDQFVKIMNDLLIEG